MVDECSGEGKWANKWAQNQIFVKTLIAVEVKREHKSMKKMEKNHTIFTDCGNSNFSILPRVWIILLSWPLKSLWMVTSAMTLKDVCFWKESYDIPREHIKNKFISADKGPSSENYGFSNSHVCMWELDHEEDWALKNWCFRIVVLEKTLESPLDCKEIKPVNPKGNQPWIFIDRTDAEAEALIHWPPDGKELTHWKRPWCWEGLKAGEGGDRGSDG